MCTFVGNPMRFYCDFALAGWLQIEFLILESTGPKFLAPRAKYF